MAPPCNWGKAWYLKFAESAKLYVEGTLTALGTLNNPVVFTGMKNIAGSWGGVEFAGTTNSANYLRGTVIEYGGGADVRAAVAAGVSGLFSGPFFRMEDTYTIHLRRRSTVVLATFNDHRNILNWCCALEVSQTSCVDEYRV